MKENNASSQKARLIAMIHRDEMDFIDKIGKDALFTTGRKLSRTDVVSAVLSAAAQLGINGKNINSEEELREYINNVIEKKNNEPEKTKSQEKSEE